MKELQDIFDRPPSYGKDVVWGPWSVHDAANVLRRYLNRMPVSRSLPAATFGQVSPCCNRNRWYRTSCMTTFVALSVSSLNIWTAVRG